MLEGDNLEVMKLFQKSYAGKVKLIYIDPPYNISKDFIFSGNDCDNIHNYLDMDVINATCSQSRKAYAEA